MKRAKPSHTDQSTYAGPLSRPVQVNFSEEQKVLLITKSIDLGVPLAVYIRMAALTQSDAVKAAVAEAKRGMR